MSDPAYHRALEEGRRLYTPEAGTVVPLGDWVNPSSSFPLMAVARHHSVPYGLVLRYAENLWGDMSGAQIDALRAELSNNWHPTGNAHEQTVWMRDAARAVAAELRRRREARAD